MVQLSTEPRRQLHRANRARVALADVTNHNSMGNAEYLQLDAVVVPSVRTADQLAQAVRIARKTGAMLVVICSRKSLAREVIALAQKVIGYGGSSGDLNLVAVQFHTSDTYLLRLGTNLFPEAVYRRSSDLSDKKNAALLLARMLEWRSLLFLDDDIELEASDVQSELGLLGRYSAVGYRIGGYPDGSVVSHVQRALNNLAGSKDEKRFISGGSALLLDPITHPSPFFPNIYNEDWLFLYDLIRDERFTEADREAKQRPYNPFVSIERAVNEEFGELVTWGIYSLLDDNNGPAAADEEFWTDYLEQRRRMLTGLIASVRHIDDSSLGGRMEAALKAAEMRRREIAPRSLAEYVTKWRSDLERWLELLEAIPRFDTVGEALIRLGQTDYTELKRASDSRRGRTSDGSVVDRLKRIVKTDRPYKRRSR